MTTGARLIHVLIDGPPVPGARPRAKIIPAHGTGAMHTQARPAIYLPSRGRMRQWQRCAAAEILRARANQCGGQVVFPEGHPIEVFILVVLGWPASEIRKARPRAWLTKAVGDWDNFAKPVCDAANGVLWHDDRQIVRGTVEKIIGHPGERPRLELIARAVTSEPTETLFDSVRKEGAPRPV